VAELTGKNREIEIHRHLASQSGMHPGSDRILVPLDHFKVQGPNGEHDVLVLQVTGPNLGDIFNMFDDEPTVTRQEIRSLMYQVALGVSFLHDRGVIHGGR
jgi:serine/threonine-protein kinase SRPK3